VSLYNYEEFVVAVVNAHDRATRAGLRKRFMNKYRSWFPEDSKDEEDGQRAVNAFEYLDSKVNFWWCEPLVTVESMRQDDNPDLALNIAILRDKLRFAWAHSRDEAMVCKRLYEFRMALFTYQRLRNWYDRSWRHRAEGALCWLSSNLHRLLVCQNPECDGENRWFLREWNNQKYCSEECSQRGHELKRLEQQKKLPAKRYKKSEETRRKMALSAQERWRRTKEGGKKGKKPKARTNSNKSS
jgi:hypothetical protein